MTSKFKEEDCNSKADHHRSTVNN